VPRFQLCCITFRITGYMSVVHMLVFSVQGGGGGTLLSPTDRASESLKSTGRAQKTYLLTLWSRVLLEKRTALQLVKKFPEFYGTRRFLTALTSARHVSLS
jgi:hypothetical protein